MEFLKKIKKHRSFYEGYHLLLYSLALLFILRPYNESSFYLGIWKLIITTSILFVVFQSHHSKKTRIIEICLAIPAVIFCWWDIFWHQHWSLIISTLLTIFFTFLAAFYIIQNIFRKTKVDFETLRAAICAYILLAIAFAYLYWLIEWMFPGSFLIEHATVSIFSYAQYMSEMFYFSFVTLLTIGFGDIVPTYGIAQSATIIEGITGQFYMTILIARLISLYSAQSRKEENN